MAQIPFRKGETLKRATDYVFTISSKKRNNSKLTAPAEGRNMKKLITTSSKFQANAQSAVKSTKPLCS